MKKSVFKVAGRLAVILVVMMMCMASVTAEASTKKSVKVSKKGYEAAEPFYKDIILVKQGGKWGMATLSGKQLVSCQFAEVYSDDKIVCFLKKVKRGEDGSFLYAQGCYIYNSKGKLLYSLKENNKDGLLIGEVAISKGVVLIKAGTEKNWWGSVYTNKYYTVTTDKSGDKVKKTEWNQRPGGNALRVASGIANGKVIVMKEDICYYHNGKKLKNLQIENETYSYNTDKYIFSHFYYATEPSREDPDHYYVYNIKTQKSYLIDTVTSGYPFHGMAGNNVVISNEDHSLYGLYTIKGKKITKKVYSYLECTDDVKQYYLVCKNGKYFYIDKNGKEYGKQYKDVGKFVDGKAIVLDKNGKAFIIDEKFRQISESVKADSVATLRKNSFCYGKNGKQYALTINGGNQ